MKTGKVFLLGAGPGDPELMTVKSVKILQQADVVLIDDLVNPEILSLCPQARVVPVGKRGGCQSTPQHFIERMMVALAEQGNIVVRLKGGDPFVFGRGGEELLALREANIPCEVVPGITSGFATCTRLQVPMTHRSLNHGVTLVTGHSHDGTPIQWQALVQSQTTLLIYMGLQNLHEITCALMEAGMSPDMPCMVVANCTRLDQKTAISTLYAIPMLCHQLEIASPAMIVVGEVVRYAQQNSQEDYTQTTLQSMIQMASAA